MHKKLLKSIMLSLPVPVLFLWAFLNFWNTNRHEIFNVPLAAGYVSIFGLAATILAILVLLIMPKQAEKLSVFIYFLVIAFFLFAPIQEALAVCRTCEGYIRLRYFALVFGAAIIVLSMLSYRFRPSSGVMRPFLLLATFLAFLPGVQLLGYFAFSDENASLTGMEELKRMPGAVRRPNIYHFILDGYGRADQLKVVTGFDNSKFLDFLKEREFLVSPQSHSNYNQTFYSVGTMMRAKYATETEPDIFKNRFNVFPIHRLRAMGYDMISITQERIGICPNGFKCIYDEKRDSFALGNLHIFLLKMTPLFKVIEKVGPTIFEGTRHYVEDAHKGWAALSHSGPFYFHAHIFMPHYPYSKDKDCRTREEFKTGGITAKVASVKDAYIGFLQCTNLQVERFLKDILKKDPEAFIIIQSDHGSDVVWPENISKPPLDAYEERYGNLNIWRMPDVCRKYFSPSMTPINTFPLVFACLTDVKPEFLPNRAYRVYDGGGDTEVRLVRKDEKWVLP